MLLTRMQTQKDVISWTIQECCCLPRYVCMVLYNFTTKIWQLNLTFDT